MLINKQPLRDSVVTVHVQHARPVQRASLWRYGGANLEAIVKLPEMPVSVGTLKLTLPGYSITLIRFR